MRDPAARPMVAVPVSEVQAWIPRAAALIDRLSQENARLRAALEPFARHRHSLEQISRDDLLRAACALDDPDGDRHA
jgi:hypothetical protein